MRYNILLIDADDTIFDFYASGERCFIKAFLSLGIKADENEYALYSKINQKRWDLFSLGKINKRDVVIGRFEEYAQTKNISFDYEKMYELYENNLSSTCIYNPNAKETLIELKESGARLFLITNGLKHVQRGRLAISGIESLFEGIFISDEIGLKKPSKEYFDYTSARINNFDKSQTLIIGDSLVSDITLGINNNVDTCLYNPKNLPNKSKLLPTFEINELPQILEIIK